MKHSLKFEIRFCTDDDEGTPIYKRRIRLTDVWNCWAVNFPFIVEDFINKWVKEMGGEPYHEDE